MRLASTAIFCASCTCWPSFGARPSVCLENTFWSVVARAKSGLCFKDCVLEPAGKKSKAYQIYLFVVVAHFVDAFTFFRFYFLEIFFYWLSY